MVSCYTELHKWDMFSSGQVPGLMPGTWSCLLAFLGGRPKVKSRHHRFADKSTVAETNQKVPKVLIAPSHP